MAIEPVVYGASERAPRGDYSRAAANYTCPQNFAAYTAAVMSNSCSKLSITKYVC